VMLGVAYDPSVPICYSRSFNLESEIPKLTSNASVSRSFSTGRTILASWLVRHDPDVVVVHLGTNGPPTSAQFSSFMEVAEDVPRVLFVTIKRNVTSAETAANNVIRSNAAKYENAELVDWYAVSTAQLNMDAIDKTYGAHLWSVSARRVYVGMVKDAIEG